MKLLDTSVAVDHLRGEEAAVTLLRGLIGDEVPVLASEVVRFELLAGVRDSELEAIEQFFTALTWVPVDEEIARMAGALRRRHGRAYSGIDDADYLIAATAIALEGELLTTDVRYFPMLDGLRPAY